MCRRIGEVLFSSFGTYRRVGVSGNNLKPEARALELQHQSDAGTQDAVTFRLDDGATKRMSESSDRPCVADDQAAMDSFLLLSTALAMPLSILWNTR